jgi:Na+-transporting NADH:ubiquinone oxidoreductase subunit B
VIKRFFQKQTIMRRVLLSLVPIYLLGLYLYGWRLLFLAALIFPVGIACEYILEKRKNKKISEAVLVTCSLYLLSLPAHTPWWIAIVGIIFGVVIGKEVYGGFGRNIFNPAISGRLFVYIAFPNPLQSGYLEPGRFGIGVDAVSGATNLGILRDGGSIDWLMSFLGIRPGAMGESSILLILLAAAYLIVTRTASWRIILSTFLSAAVLTTILHYAGVAAAFFPLDAVLSGSIFFVCVFIATDPVSAPKKSLSHWLYGLIIGSTSILIRTFSLFPEGTSFGVLLGNTFASLLDRMAGRLQSSQKEARA